MVLLQIPLEVRNDKDYRLQRSQTKIAVGETYGSMNEANRILKGFNGNMLWQHLHKYSIK